MSIETKEMVNNLISYYRAHSMVKFVEGDEQRLKHFVTDDFTKLLAHLESEL